MAGAPSCDEPFDNGNVVVVLIDVDLTMRTTGRRVVEEDEAHICRRGGTQLKPLYPG
jgi:hypothetical protein